jgi:hypothetical protein
MPHDLLNDPRGYSGGVGEGCRLTAERMEVKYQIGCIAVGNAGGSQIVAEHLGALTVLHAKHWLPGCNGGHIGGQISHQIDRQGESRRLTVLRVGGGYRDAGGRPVE